MITLDKIKKLLILERITTVLMAGTITLAWDANTEPDLAGYKIHYGSQPGIYTTTVDVRTDEVGWSAGCPTPYDPFNAECCEFTLKNLVVGQTYYIAGTAYDEDGNESAYSIELVHTVRTTGKEKSLNKPSGYIKK